MTLNTLYNGLRKLTMGLAVTGATAFQAGGCSVNIDGESLTDLVDSVIGDDITFEDGWDDGWDDSWDDPMFPVEDEFPVDDTMAEFPEWY